MIKEWILAGLGLIAFVTADAQAKKPTPAAGTAIARGKVVYNQICISCHQQDGSGVPRMNPPLIKTKYVLGDKPTLIGVVLKGLNEEVEIDGEYYSNPMPSQAALTDQQISDVLTFIRSSFGNKASAVTVNDVKKARASLTK
jgi:mono/diheme cytochrome c family protein